MNLSRLYIYSILFGNEFLTCLLSGTESETIPVSVLANELQPLACPNAETYFVWEGKSTSAQYYVNPKGVSAEDGCQWGDGSQPIGNWAPINIGVGQKNGYWLSIFQNKPTTNAKLDYNLRIEGDNLSGACKYEDGLFYDLNGSNEDGCTVSSLMAHVEIFSNRLLISSFSYRSKRWMARLPSWRTSSVPVLRRAQPIHQPVPAGRTNGSRSFLVAVQSTICSIVHLARVICILSIFLSCSRVGLVRLFFCHPTAPYTGDIEWLNFNVITVCSRDFYMFIPRPESARSNKTLQGR